MHDSTGSVSVWGMMALLVVAVISGPASGETVGPYDIAPIAWVDEMRPHGGLHFSSIGTGQVVGSDLKSASSLAVSGGGQYNARQIARRRSRVMFIWESSEKLNKIARF